MKIAISKLFVVLVAITFMVSACKKEAKDCSELQADVSRTQTIYVDDVTSVTKCEDYRVALQAYVDASCQDPSGFQTAINNLPCQ